MKHFQLMVVQTNLSASQKESRLFHFGYLRCVCVRTRTHLIHTDTQAVSLLADGGELFSVS